jgi:chloride channel 3/4/5
MQAPLTISINSPLELVQQFFVKLGARYVVVTDAAGFCELFHSLKPHHARTISLDEGVIDKNGWLAFLGELETKSG